MVNIEFGTVETGKSISEILKDALEEMCIRDSIMGGATLIAYIIGEGMADSANAGVDAAVGIEVVEDD